MTGLPYRPCVVAVIRGHEPDKYLVGERVDSPGCWQFPQGGIDTGESEKTAFLRELEEEIGTNDCKIIRQTSEWVYYDFPQSVSFSLKNYFKGQKQIWFLATITNTTHLDLSNPPVEEFSRLSWMPLDAVIDQAIFWKKQAYQSGLQLLGLC